MTNYSTDPIGGNQSFSGVSNRASQLPMLSAGEVSAANLNTHLCYLNSTVVVGRPLKWHLIYTVNWAETLPIVHNTHYAVDADSHTHANHILTLPPAVSSTLGDVIRVEFVSNIESSAVVADNKSVSIQTIDGTKFRKSSQLSRGLATTATQWPKVEMIYAANINSAATPSTVNKLTFQALLNAGGSVGSYANCVFLNNLDDATQPGQWHIDAVSLQQELASVADTSDFHAV